MNYNNLELFDDLTVAINEVMQELEIYKRETIQYGQTNITVQIKEAIKEFKTYSNESKRLGSGFLK